MFKDMIQMCHGLQRPTEDIMLINYVTDTEKVVKVSSWVLYNEIIIQSFFRDKKFKEYVNMYSSKNFNLIVDYFLDESAWNENISELKKREKSFSDYFDYNNICVLKEKSSNKFIVKICIICIGCFEDNWEMHLLAKIEE